MEARLRVSKWNGDTAVEWKCSCGGWAIELPVGPGKPQEKAAIVSNAYARHIQAAHPLRPVARLEASRSTSS